MRKSSLGIVIGLAIFALAFAAYMFVINIADIRDVYMARDAAGVERITTFSPDDVFYCIVELENAPKWTRVKVVWYAVDVENVEPNTMIDEYEATTSDGTLPFNLVSNNGPWPKGQYKAKVYLNGWLRRTLEFEVQ